MPYKDKNERFYHIMHCLDIPLKADRILAEWEKREIDRTIERMERQFEEGN